MEEQRREKGRKLRKGKMHNLDRIHKKLRVGFNYRKDIDVFIIP